MGADRTAYAVHPLPLADVKALRRYVPAFGTHHVVVILANGLTLPPLFFGQGGVRAFFSALKEVCIWQSFKLCWVCISIFATLLIPRPTVMTACMRDLFVFQHFTCVWPLTRCFPKSGSQYKHRRRHRLLMLC